MHMQPKPEADPATMAEIFELLKAEIALELQIDGLKAQIKDLRESLADAQERRADLVRHADQGRLAFGEAG